MAQDRKKRNKIQPPTLVSRMTGKVNTYMECLVEHPCGKREYMTGKEFDNLSK